MKVPRFISLFALLLSPGLASGQTPSPAASSPQPAAQPTMLLVLNATDARLAGQKLTLDGVSPRAIFFANHPARDVGLMPTPDLVALWTNGTFAKDPPNATISKFFKDGSDVTAVVAVLKSPKLEGEQLTFDVQLLGGSFGAADGPAAIFIDTVWFQLGKGYIGTSPTTGGTSATYGTSNPADGGWSNPAPSAPPYRPHQGTGLPGSAPSPGNTLAYPPSTEPTGLPTCGAPPLLPCY